MTDPNRQDPNVGIAIARLAAHCGTVVADIQRLDRMLAAGRGWPHPGEMTPDEANTVAEIIGRIGRAGAVLLTADTVRTFAREERASPKGPERPN